MSSSGNVIEVEFDKYGDMTVTFTNCSFLRTQVKASMQTLGVQTLSFVDCHFEGSPQDHKISDEDDSGAVNVYHSNGELQALFLRCEFVNNVNGAILLNSYTASYGPRTSYMVIDSCLFHTSSNRNETTIEGDRDFNNEEADNINDSRGRDVVNHYPAVTLQSYNASVLIRNSTFDSLSVQSNNNYNYLSDFDYSRDDADKKNSKYSNSININQEDEDRDIEVERSVGGDSFDGDVSAAIYVKIADYSIVPGHIKPNVTIDSCLFRRNWAFGGAVHVAAGLSMINDCVFDGNQGTLGGAFSTKNADLPIWPTPSLVITGSHFVNNSALSQGGVFYTSNSNLSFARSTFEHNRAIYGAVGYVDGSELSQVYETLVWFEDCAFLDNIALHRSGVGSIYAMSAQLQISNSRVESGSMSVQVFLYLLGSNLDATNCSVYGTSFLNMNGGAATLEDIRFDSTKGMILADGSLHCNRCNVNNTVAFFDMSLPFRLWATDSNFTFNKQVILTDSGSASDLMEATFERCFFYQNEVSVETILTNVTLLSSTLIAINGSKPVFYLSGSSLNVIDSVLLIHRNILGSIEEGEIYFYNTTVADAIDPSATNFRAVGVYTSGTKSMQFVNSSFSSMSFVAYKVREYIEIDLTSAVTN